MKKLVLNNAKAGLTFVSLSAAIMQLAYAMHAVELFGYFYKGSIAVMFMVMHLINQNAFHFKSKGFNFLCTFALITTLTVTVAYLSLLVSVHLYRMAGGRP